MICLENALYPRTVNVSRALHQAEQALAETNDERALEALLSAWRELPHPRIADLVDRVSARITEARGAIEGKSVATRSKTWAAIAKKKDPADLGRLLATPWPGTWKGAIVVRDALTTFGPDPRLAMAFTALIMEGAYDSLGGTLLTISLIQQIGKHRDARTLPLLKSEAEHVRERFWRERVRPAIANVVKTLEALAPPQLEAAVEEALGNVERHFARAVADEATAVRGEADFLRAIYERPDDDGLRSVYADWLTERGDPRGELITLQLARARGEETPATRKREAALLKKHGDAWIAPFTEDLVPKKAMRVFERGFLSQVVLGWNSREGEIPRKLSEPGWATVERVVLSTGLSFDKLVTTIMTLPSMRSVRAVVGVDEANLVEMIDAGGAERFEEIVVSGTWAGRPDEIEDNDALRRRLASGEGLPHLRRLGIERDIDDLGALLDGELARRLEEVTVYDAKCDLGALSRLVDARRLTNVRRVRVASESSPDRDEATYVTTLERDESGRWSRVSVRPIGAMTASSSHDLVRALESLPPKSLTELRVDLDGRPWKTSAEPLANLKHVVSLHELVTVDIPWEHAIASPRATPTSAIGATLVLNVAEDRFPPERFSELWPILIEPVIGLSFDSVDVNGEHTPLDPKKPAAFVVKQLAKKRTLEVNVYKGGVGDSEVRIRRDTVQIRSPLDVATTASVDAYLSWADRLIAAAGDRARGYCPFMLPKSEDGREIRVPAFGLRDIQPFSRRFEWMWTFGGHPFLSLDDLEALIAQKHPFLRTVRFRTELAIVMSSSPHELPDFGACRAFELDATALGWRAFAERHGFVPRDLLSQSLGRLLHEAGFEEIDLTKNAPTDAERAFSVQRGKGWRPTSLDQAMGFLYWLRRNEQGTQVCALRSPGPLGSPTASTLMVMASPNGDVDPYEVSSFEKRRRLPDERISDELKELSFETRRDANKTVAALSRYFEEDVIPWFDA